MPLSRVLLAVSLLLCLLQGCVLTSDTELSRPRTEETPTDTVQGDDGTVSDPVDLATDPSDIEPEVGDLVFDDLDTQPDEPDIVVDQADMIADEADIETVPQTYRLVSGHFVTTPRSNLTSDTYRGSGSSGRLTPDAVMVGETYRIQLGPPTFETE